MSKDKDDLIAKLEAMLERVKSDKCIVTSWDYKCYGDVVYQTIQGTNTIPSINEETVCVRFMPLGDN